MPVKTVKKSDNAKKVGRDAQTGKYVPTKDDKFQHIPSKKDSGGTESTGPKKK